MKLFKVKMIYNPVLNYLNEEPLREELFSSEQMEQFGKTLAKRHKLSTKPAQDHLLKRLAENEIILLEARKLKRQSPKPRLRPSSIDLVGCCALNLASIALIIVGASLVVR